MVNRQQNKSEPPEGKRSQSQDTFANGDYGRFKKAAGSFHFPSDQDTLREAEGIDEGALRQWMLRPGLARTGDRPPGPCGMNCNRISVGRTCGLN